MGSVDRRHESISNPLTFSNSRTGEFKHISSSKGILLRDLPLKKYSEMKPYLLKRMQLAREQQQSQSSSSNAVSGEDNGNGPAKRSMIYSKNGKTDNEGFYESLTPKSPRESTGVQAELPEERSSQEKSANEDGVGNSSQAREQTSSPGADLQYGQLGAPGTTAPTVIPDPEIASKALLVAQRVQREAMDSGKTKSRQPKCAVCRNHRQEVPLRGHKRFCPYKYCKCVNCTLITQRRDIMAKQVALRRAQAQDEALGLTRASPEIPSMGASPSATTTSAPPTPAPGPSPPASSPQPHTTADEGPRHAMLTPPHSSHNSTSSSPEPAVRYDYKKKTSAARLESLLAAREALREVRDETRLPHLPMSPRSASPQEGLTLPSDQHQQSPQQMALTAPSSDPASVGQPLTHEVKTVLLEQAFVQQQQQQHSGQPGGMWLPQIPGNCLPAIPQYLQSAAALEVAFKGAPSLGPPVAAQFNQGHPFIGGNSLWLYMQPGHGVLVPKEKLPPVPKLQMGRMGAPGFDAPVGRCSAEEQHAFTM